MAGFPLPPATPVNCLRVRGEIAPCAFGSVWFRPVGLGGPRCSCRPLSPPAAAPRSPGSCVVRALSPSSAADRSAPTAPTPACARAFCRRPFVLAVPGVPLTLACRLSRPSAWWSECRRLVPPCESTSISASPSPPRPHPGEGRAHPAPGISGAGQRRRSGRSGRNTGRSLSLSRSSAGLPCRGPVIAPEGQRLPPGALSSSSTVRKSRSPSAWLPPGRYCTGDASKSPRARTHCVAHDAGIPALFQGNSFPARPQARASAGGPCGTGRRPSMGRRHMRAPSAAGARESGLRGRFSVLEGLGSACLPGASRRGCGDRHPPRDAFRDRLVHGCAKSPWPRRWSNAQRSRSCARPLPPDFPWQGVPGNSPGSREEGKP